MWHLSLLFCEQFTKLKNLLEDEFPGELEIVCVFLMIVISCNFENKTCIVKCERTKAQNIVFLLGPNYFSNVNFPSSDWRGHTLNHWLV